MACQHTADETEWLGVAIVLLWIVENVHFRQSIKEQWF